ncbi:MAG: hypothetical protein Q8P97_01395, partial [bacterium]|nr:hypothetical protein [bacterium]
MFGIFKVFSYDSHAMKILAIETSCDETAIAIIEYSNSRGLSRINTRTDADRESSQRVSASSQRKSAYFKVLSNLVSSQVKIHEKFGGVVPNLARREHEKNLVPVLLKALKEADLYQVSSIKYQVSDLKIINSILERERVLREKFIKYILPLPKPKIDAIAVTYGPGLAPALWAGVNFGKALSTLWRLPLVPVNHMEGHIFSALLCRKNSDTRPASRAVAKAYGGVRPKLQRGEHATRDKKNTGGYSLVAIRYPAIALLVSGGHTELHLVKKLGKYRRLGETLDDAAGEAFDKVAKMLGLPYPGGPEISKWAEKGNPSAIAFPRP